MRVPPAHSSGAEDLGESQKSHHQVIWGSKYEQKRSKDVLSEMKQAKGQCLVMLEIGIGLTKAE